MNEIVLLDASPLGMISNPNATPVNLECYNWMESLIMSGCRVIVPEIADYEIRRELIMANKIRGLARLDLLKNTLDYLPLTTDIMLKAAALWAQARNQGTPTADAKALDCDVILAAQALAAGGIIATENVGHLSLFVEAKDWRDILPVS
jgi:predicted nucleic acid-binding protein